MRLLLALILLPCALLALAPRTLLTWQIDPFVQTTQNVVIAIERMTPLADGGLTVDVSLSMQPTKAPTIQFSFSSSGGRTVCVMADAANCSFPTQSMTVGGRYVYAYTLPAPMAEGKKIKSSQIVCARRCRYGGEKSSGMRLEGGGYAVVTADGVYMGRSGTFVIGGHSVTFAGGVLLEPSAPAPAPAAARRSRAVVLPDTETRINGKTLSFPIRRQK